MKSMVDLSHAFLKPVLHAQAICVDATLGQGKDTEFFLSQNVRRVYGFEIQKDVYVKTKQKIQNEKAALYCIGHEHMAEIIHESVDVIIFNFGYFPSGDHALTTHVDTSIQAIQQGLSLLKIKGRMALVLYPHEEGKKEALSIEAYLKGCRNLQIHKVQNFMVEQCPYLLFIEKRR